MRFAKLHEVRWSSAELSDPTLFGESLHFLDRTEIYIGIRRFFLKTIGVEEKPHANDYAQLLEQVVSRYQQNNRSDPTKLTKSIFSIYADSRLVQYLPR